MYRPDGSVYGNMPVGLGRPDDWEEAENFVQSWTDEKIEVILNVDPATESIGAIHGSGNLSDVPQRYGRERIAHASLHLWASAHKGIVNTAQVSREPWMHKRVCGRHPVRLI